MSVVLPHASDVVSRDVPVQTVCLSLSYDGTAYAGWAVQVDRETVASCLLRALRVLAPDVRGLRGTSRTDAGVHARDQVVAFQTDARIPARGWVLGTNTHLPEDIAVVSARVLPLAFVPRFHVVDKTYSYTVRAGRVRDPLRRDVSWHVPYDVDMALLRAEAESMQGTYDFSAFRSSQDKRTNRVRTLSNVSVTESDGCFVLSVTGTGFMHNMVRILVGTLVEVGARRRAPGTVLRAVRSGVRMDAGITAPASGLCLEHTNVRWPEGSDPWWPEREV